MTLTSPSPRSDLETLTELEPIVAKEIDRHLAAADEWFPHQYVPWSQGRDYDGPMGGEGWEPGDSKVSAESREALLVNLLTEDNLPGYHASLKLTLGQDGPWMWWANRWTAEENRHGIVIRDYLTVTRAIDPIALERARMHHMQEGYDAAHGTDPIRGLAYVSFQELATRVSHRNTGKVSGDPFCEAMMTRVAKDENLHMIFYRNMLKAAFELNPSATMCAVSDVVREFQMPGHAIDGFMRKSVQIAKAGIYDLRLHHDDVLSPVLRFWNVWDMEGLNAEGEQARLELSAFMQNLDEAATKFEDRRAAQRARAEARQA
ncbi:acyl-ACP desaturase [Actinocorallia longicatena]|uniref:Acyl-ACP desaturase n=1 Tax=Actinocorallia longicatena TaxID=111803 RepID=A0ABP6QP41_9ACTN